MIVLCGGMLRSGSTLQYNMVRSIVMHSGTGRAEGFFSEADYEARRAEIESWKLDDVMHVMKMHVFPPEMRSDRSVKVCYIYRDVRDVAASVKRKWPDRDLVATVEHALAIDEQADGIEGILVQRYEDVMKDGTTAVAELAASLGVELSPQTLESIAAENSVAAAKQRMGSLARSSLWRRLKSRLGLAAEVYDTTTLLHPNHVSSTDGASGVWRTVLSDAEQRILLEKFRSWLVSRGYEEVDR